MKILHTADWHIGQFKGPVVDGVNLRSQDTVKCLEYMVQVAIEEKPDIVCVSGDIFHQEQVGPVRYSDEMITATNIITSLAHFSKYVIVMRGTPNHDGAAQFRVLERMLLNIRNVDVVTEPGVIKTPWADIACLPGFDKQEFRAKFPGLSADEENLAWTKYISDMVFALRAECEKTPILMAHYTVPGCNMESGQTSFFTNFEPVIPREALMAARYEAVLLGHIHRPQIIEGFDNVFYSGAINAMNFNDEGQERGFWIHEFNEKGTLVKGHRYTTPYRQFHTIIWDPDEVGDYIREGAMYLHRTGISEEVTDKIVRVRYSCTSEQKKALNIPLLQKNLYELGAFYVADIEAESTIDITNRGLLSEESDPRLNLKKWLEEKTFKNPDKIVELAEPIIAEAMKQSTTAEIHGVFKPVSISVRNYRNYKEESFDFSDISFCTINGVNGAGKSSLFMDAIVDCLFEETREGDCKAWIRGTEDAGWAAYWWNYEQLEFLTAADARKAENVYRKWLEDKENHTNQTAFELLHRYQENIKAIRLAKKHKKETDIIDLEMEKFGNLPDDYQIFVEEIVFKDENYIFYNTKKKSAFCTSCKKNFILENKHLRHKTIAVWNNRDEVKHNRIVRCPYCNKYLQAKSTGMGRSSLKSVAWSVLIQSKGEDVLTRYFCHIKDFRADFNNPKITSYEG